MGLKELSYRKLYLLSQTSHRMNLCGSWSVDEPGLVLSNRTERPWLRRWVKCWLFPHRT